MKNIAVTIIFGAVALGGSAHWVIAKEKTLSQAEIAALAAKHHAALEANRKAMHEYSWQYRTEVWENDQLQWIDLVNVNLNAQGLPVFTQINRETTVARKHGIFSKKNQQKGFENVDRIVNYVADWVTWYNRMPLSRVTELFDQGAKSGVSPASANGNLLRINGINIRDSNANDRVSLWMDKENCHPMQFSFTIPVVKTLDGAAGETINAKLHYRYLRNGEAFYADHIVILVPTRNLKIKVENLNMMKKL